MWSLLSAKLKCGGCPCGDLQPRRRRRGGRGGVALIRAIPAIDALKLDGDAKLGARIVSRALREPLRIIANNAGVEGAVVVNAVVAAKGDEGYDAVTETYGNLPERGIIDPPTKGGHHRTG